MLLEDLFELLYRHVAPEVFPDVGHPAANRFDALGLDFIGRNLQRLRKYVKIGIKHEGPVVHDPVCAQILGVAGKLFPPDGDVVAPAQLRVTPRGQRLYDGDAERGQIKARVGRGVHDEGVVEISQS
jgi:hypothetical protein